MLQTIFNNITSFFQNLVNSITEIFDFNYSVLTSWLPSDIASTADKLVEIAIWIGSFFLLKKVVDIIVGAFNFL